MRRLRKHLLTFYRPNNSCIKRKSLTIKKEMGLTDKDIILTISGLHEALGQNVASFCQMNAMGAKVQCVDS